MENPKDEKKEIIRSKTTADLARFSSSALIKWGLDFQKIIQKQTLISILWSIWNYCKEVNSNEIFSGDNISNLDDFCENKEIIIKDVIYTFETPVYQRIAAFLTKSARLRSEELV